MAGDWLKVEASLPEKPEVFAITAAMGWADPDLTVGKLFRVWRWFDQHTLNGNARSVTPALLDTVAMTPGFAQAMASVGWLIVAEDGVFLPNFDRHNGKTAKTRALTARRVSEHKKGNAQGNGSSVTASVPREEKRKEEPQEGSTAIAPAAAIALEGVFEGHVNPDFTPTPAVLMAKALISAGIQATSMNAELVAYAEEGGTPEHILEVAQLDKCRGKNCTYIAKAARGELADSASVITPGVPRGTTQNLSAVERARVAFDDITGSNGAPDHALVDARVIG